MSVRIHPTALVDKGVEIGPGTVISEQATIRTGARIGAGCILGNKTHIGSGVQIGDHVHIGPLVCLGDGVQIEQHVLIDAGTILGAGRHPRAARLALAGSAALDVTNEPRPTLVREGATLGAHCTVANDLQIGRFAMLGMGAVVTCSVADFHLVAGNPARPAGCVCRCGQVLLWFIDTSRLNSPAVACAHCGLRFAIAGGLVIEQAPAATQQAA